MEVSNFNANMNMITAGKSNFDKTQMYFWEHMAKLMWPNVGM
jgi:hypothetical protein